MNAMKEVTSVRTTRLRVKLTTTRQQREAVRGRRDATFHVLFLCLFFVIIFIFVSVVFLYL